MLISVCIATYNGEKYIREQLDSILNQDLSKYSNAELEIIISDDLSTDNTVNIIQSYQDKRISVYKHTQKKTHKYYNAMFACTLNFGFALSKAKGDYIFLSDQDDVWHPLKISKSLDILIEKGGYVATAFDIVNDDLKIYGNVEYFKEPRWRLKRKSLLYGFSCGFTKEEMKYLLPIPEVPHHDNFMMLVASFRNKFSFTNEHLVVCKV